jgi:hypothetical protein
MFLTLSVLCVIGVCFYVRFIFDLCKECRWQQTTSWILVRLHQREQSLASLFELGEPSDRAA